MYDLRFVLVWFFCCCDQCHDHKQLGEESAYFSFRLESRQEWRSGQEAWRQKLKDWMQRPRRNTADWLDLYGSFSLLYYTTRDPLARGATSPSSLGLPTPTVNQEIVLQTFPWASLMEAISQLRFPVSR